MVPFKYFNWDAERPGMYEQGRHFCPHIEAVTVIQNAKVTQVNHQGVEERTLTSNKSGRGSTVCITFHTEDGHRFYRLFQFHKGDVYEQETPEEPLVESESPAEIPELWRD